MAIKVLRSQFNSTWDYYAPLTEMQQAAILMLSQAVAKRPFSANVVVNDTMSLEQMIRQEILSPTATNGSTIEESGAIEAVLVNTNQLLEEQCLVEFAEALRTKLNYFDELENVASSFYAPNMNVGSGNFLPLLKRLDDCISRGSWGVIRSRLLSVLKSTTSQVLGLLRSSSGSNTTVSEVVEGYVIYVRFKAAASELKPVASARGNREQSIKERIWATAY